MIASRRERKLFLKNTGAILLLLIFAAVSSRAAEIRILVPSYEGAELAKVREWEKQWAGKKIDKTNVGQVSDFLPEPMVKVLQDPAFMNAKEYWFEIVPYQQASYSKGQVEMTKKYAPVAKLDGDLLVDYANMAGFIFPEPKTGIEVAYNFDMQTFGDSKWDRPCGSVVEPRTGFERVQCRDEFGMYWTGRTFTPPYPKLPENKKDFRETRYSMLLSPPDFKGGTVLNIRYNDINRETDRWIYMARFRRIRRVSAAQRGDQTDGTELIQDDSPALWADHMNRNTYKILGRKELLLSRHQDMSKLTYVTGSGVYNGNQRERIKTYEVEAVYKQPNYPYSKQIWYVDPELWIILAKLCWDEDGNFWRYHDESYTKTPTTEPGEYAYTPAMRIGWDMIGRHASHNSTEFTKDVGKRFPDRMFTVHFLSKGSY